MAVSESQDANHSINELEQQKKILVRLTDSLSEKIVIVEKEKSEAEKKALQERYQAIGELASRIAHDMRNPLSIIKNQVEIIKILTKNDPKISEGFERIDKAVWRMSHQVDTVLDFIKTGPTNMDACSVLSILQESAESVSLFKHIQVNLPQSDAVVECDGRLLKIALGNLFVNAAQAMNGLGQINVKLETNKDTIQISIQDFGPGIEEKDLLRIFEPLYTTKQQGTGLGLSTVKNIIENHGGTIYAKNNPTTFVVELPYFRA